MYYKEGDNMGKKITLTEVKHMGFSDKLIATLLPEPKLVKNSYSSSYPMKLWDLDIVKKAMGKKEFIEYQAKRKKRKKAAEKQEINV